MTERRSQTRTLNMVLRGDGVLEAELKPGLVQTVEDVEENLAAGRAITEGKRVPMLFDSRDTGPLSIQVRRAYEPIGEFASAAALIVESPFSRAVANFFLRVDRSGLPIRVFDDRQEAEAWLEQLNPTPGQGAPSS